MAILAHVAFPSMAPEQVARAESCSQFSANCRPGTTRRVIALTGPTGESRGREALDSDR
jgi:hypothetical protein